MSDENTLVPVEQRTVTFYDDEIPAVVVESESGSTVYVPLRPVCDFLGLSWPSQNNRINRDAILNEVSETISVFVTNTQGGQHRNMRCLPLDYLNGFLFGINASRVKEEVRDRLLRYQRECYQVLAEAFIQPAASVTSATSALEQVEQMGLAIAQMAREQIEFESRLATTETRLDRAAHQFGDLTKRVTAIEDALGTSDKTVSQDQASQISQAVKTVAIAQGKVSGRNEFGAVYGELYRKFGITSYKLLPSNQFQAAMDFLSGWHFELTGESPF